VSDRSIARRYAAALFDVVQKAGQADRAGDELKSIAQLIEGHSELSRVLAAPSVPPHIKKQILSEVLKAAGSTSPEVTRLVLMLADRARLSALAELQSAYAERLLTEKKIVPAQVVTAAPLSDASRAALKKALGAATGQDVTMTERVDPSIVGGVVARVGSVVFDGSVASQLDKLRQKLATNN
jgi:F-type H+-transporting ATPase subunit delta